MQVSDGLYKKLHAYVRMRLQEVYPGKIDPKGPIPSHILGMYTDNILPNPTKERPLIPGSSRILFTFLTFGVSFCVIHHLHSLSVC